jgi:hypothetical protein
MTVHSIYDNSTITWTAQGQGAPITWGIRFQSSAGGWIKAVKWYRASTGGIRPTTLAVYDSAGPTVLHSFAPAPEDGSVGWKQTNLATPIALTASHTYGVAAFFSGAGNALGEVSSASYTAAPSPLLLDDNRRFYDLSGSLAYPTNGQTTLLIAVDIVWGDDSTPISGDPETVPTTTGDLSDWLSVAHNTKGADSAPIHVETLATGGSGFVAIKSVADAIATSVGSGLGTAVSALTTAVGTANTALVHAATTWSDALAAALQAMSDDFASFGASKPAQGGGDFGAGTFPSNVGSLVWTLLDETDFVGEIAWAQPADVYVLSITTPPHGFPINLVDGVHTIYRAGWWCPLNGSFGRQRRFIDFEDNHLEVGAERMPGVLISLQPGGEGHLQAWALT